MKKAILAVMLMGMMGSVNAVGLGPALAWTVTAGGIFVSGYNTANQEYDARHFKGVMVSHNDGTEGYTFEITQYELDQNPSAYVVK